MTTAQFLLIDGSYYIFYRFFALQNWWKMAHKDELLEDPFNNEIFKNKFKETFKSKYNELIKKLKLDNPIVLVARDCPRDEIWRMELYPEYKANRICEEDDPKSNPGSFFKMAYFEKLFEDCGAHVISHNKLEADDCIALTVKHIKRAFIFHDIKIIASDHDYFQLLDKNIEIYNLKYKNVNNEKNSSLDPKKDLFIKCVIGDKSDNIPSVFKKCGIKTASKYYDDPNKFMEKCKSEKVCDIFERNNKIIDFNKIPQELVNSFYKNTLLLKDNDIEFIIKLNEHIKSSMLLTQD